MRVAATLYRRAWSVALRAGTDVDGVVVSHVYNPSTIGVRLRQQAA
jgi:hypothetical protein